MDQSVRLSNLRRLLAPKSVAVVGASSSPDKAGYQAVDALKRFKGEVFPVNPKAGEILGHKAYSSLSAIGKPADLVIFAVPAAACVDAVREAIAAKCGAGLIMLDWLKVGDVAVPEFSEATARKIETLLPPMTYLKNPVDTARPGATFPEVLTTIANDPKIDAVIVFALHEPATLDPTGFMADVRKQMGKPLMFGTGGPAERTSPTIDALRQQGLFATESPERLAKAAIVLAHDAKAQWKLAHAAKPIKVDASQARGGLD